MHPRITGAIVAPLLLAVAAAPAFAVPITYAPPTIVGTNVDWTAVTESSTTDTEPLYGAPVAVGDSLVFTPTPTFAASASGAGAADVTTGTLAITIAAKGGFSIPFVSVVETGSYVLTDPGSIGTLATSAKVSGAMSVSITKADGGAIFFPLPLDALTVITVPDQPWEIGDDPLTGGFTATMFVDIDALKPGFITVVDEVTINLNNTLQANSEAGTTADIIKDSFTIGVPEPSTGLLLGSGMLLALLAMRRRRK